MVMVSARLQGYKVNARLGHYKHGQIKLIGFQDTNIILKVYSTVNL